MGELAFRKIQYGKETTKGTAVAATKIWPGKIVVPADRKPQFPEITSGRRARAQKGVVNQILVDGFTLSADPVPFQLLPAIFSAGLKGNITAAEQTTDQDDYLWDHTPSLTATNAPDSLTVEYGDDTQAYEIEYCMARRIKLAGSLGDDAGVSLEAEMFGKQISTSTFTASLAPLAYEFAVANLVKIYIDPAWASLGSTEKTGLLQAWDVEILTGLHPKFHAAGVKTFTGHGEGFIDAMATFTFEGGSEADGLWDVFRAGTPKAIRIEMLGSQIGTGDPYSCTIDLYGEFEEVIPLASEKNGNNLHTAIFHALDDNQATPHTVAVKVTTNNNAV